MKNKKKFLLSSLILTLILAMAVVFSGCGGPSTLEEYISSDSEAQQQIDSLSGNGMEVDITGNTVTYTYTYTQTFEGDMLTQIKDALGSEMENQESTFSGIADTLEEESGIDGVIVKVTYLDANGTELWSGEFE